MDKNNRFYKARKKKGYTQTAVAAKLKLSKAAISKWECNRTIPDQSILAKVADVYDVSVDYLLGREDDSLFVPAKMPKTEFQELFDRLTPHQQEVIIAKMEGYAEGNAERAAEERARRKKRA